jgi:hypothetical protein
MLSAGEDYKSHTGVQINLKDDSICMLPSFYIFYNEHLARIK